MTQGRCSVYLYLHKLTDWLTVFSPCHNADDVTDIGAKNRYQKTGWFSGMSDKTDVLFGRSSLNTGMARHINFVIGG